MKKANKAMQLECRGIIFPYEPEIISDRVKTSITSGRYESKEANQLQKLIKPGDQILEIGSGLGFISSLAAKHPHTKSVLCYEADPRLIKYSQELHELNGIKKVTVKNSILTTSPAPKKVPFYIRKNFWSSSLTHAKEEYISKIEVPTYSLNDVIFKYKPTFIVCDIEGAEADLFTHASLHGVTRVLIEIHSRVIGRMGVKKVFDAMSARGFAYDEFHSEGSVILFSELNR